jgi:hypothetical protein
MEIKGSSERKIMDGVLKGSLNAFQMTAKKGLLGNAGMPVHKMGSGMKANTMKAGGKEPKTKLADGFMPYQGAGPNRVSKK